MINQEERKLEAIEYSILLWEWLARTGEREKTRWPGWDFNGGQFSPQRLECFLCEYTLEAGGHPSDNCTPCPYLQKYRAKCFAMGSPFQIWRDCVVREDKKKYAAEFLKRLQALLPGRKFQIGDMVRILIGNKSDSRYFLHHKDEVGEIVAYGSQSGGGGLWRVKFSMHKGDPDKDCYYGDNDLELVATPSKTITQEAKAKLKVGDTVKITGTNWTGKTGVITKISEGRWPFDVRATDGEDGLFKGDELELLHKKVYRVYVAGALSSLPAYLQDGRSPSKVVVDYIANCSKMCEVAAEVRKLGFAPFVPALDFMMGFQAGNFTEEDYRGTGMAFLEVCDVVLAISESQGVNKELARAKELGIPWVSSITSLQAWAKKQEGK